MTNAPETRKTHVIRILGRDRDGNRLDDVWVDVERMDEVLSNAPGDTTDKQGTNFQKSKRKFRWMDDPDGDDYNPDGNPTRGETIKVKVCDPDSGDVNDPDEYVEIAVPKKYVSRASDNNYQKVNEKIRSEEDQESREFVVRKIPHYDTNIDEAADAAFADPERRVYVVSGDQYTKDLNTKDEDQYVEHEIITQIVQRGNSPKRAGGGGDQKRKTNLKNQYLINESDEPERTVVGASGINPPYRLDPYQNIVNVSWGGVTEFFKESASEIVTDIPDANKFLMDVWFRIEPEAVAEAKEEYDAYMNDPAGPRPPLLGIIPIAVWGPKTRIRTYESEDYVAGGYDYQDWAWTDGFPGFPECTGAGYIHHPFSGPGGHTDIHRQRNALTGSIEQGDPSFIGVDCSSGEPVLSINIVMPFDNAAKFSGVATDVSIVNTASRGSYFELGAHFCPGAPTTYLNPLPHYNFELDLINDGPLPGVYSQNQIEGGDYNSNPTYGPEVYRLLPNPQGRNFFFSVAIGSFDADQSYQGRPVAASRWHHLNFSCDFTRTVKTQGAKQSSTFSPDPHGSNIGEYTVSGDPATLETVGSRTQNANLIYLSLDDVNITGTELSAYHPQGYANKNAVLPVNGQGVALLTKHDLVNTGIILSGRQEGAGRTDRSATYEFTPAGVPFSDGPLGIPATLEYSTKTKHVEIGRFQMYLDVVADPSSQAVRRAFVTSAGKPASLSAASDLLGKRPEVLMRGYGDMHLGKNTGTLASQPPQNGVTVGEIERYSPSPNLYGNQG